MKLEQIKSLIHLKNLSLLGKETGFIKNNKKNLDLIGFLYTEGVIQSFKLQDTDFITIYFRHFNNINNLNYLKIFSRPSFSKNLKIQELIKLKSKNKVFCISTDKGLLPLEGCKKKHLGGKIFFSC
jgi:ribosomal protein S8